jgi:hypothetical protein
VSFARRLATFVASVLALGGLALALSAPAHATVPLVPRAFTLNPTTTTAWIWDSSVNAWTNVSRTNALPGSDEFVDTQKIAYQQVGRTWVIHRCVGHTQLYATLSPQFGFGDNSMKVFTTVQLATAVNCVNNLPTGGAGTVLNTSSFTTVIDKHSSTYHLVSPQLGDASGSHFVELDFTLLS